MPPSPIITRWGTWLNAAIYYCEHFSEVKSIVDSFDQTNAESIAESQKKFADRTVQSDLAFIKSNFSSIPTSIVKLETKGLAINESIEIVELVRANLDSLSQDKFGKKLDAVLARNPGYKQIVEISKLIHQNAQPTDLYVQSLSPNELTMFKYAPLTSSDVERSFSEFGNLFTSQRKAFLFENLKQHLVVHYNR